MDHHNRAAAAGTGDARMATIIRIDTGTDEEDSEWGPHIGVVVQCMSLLFSTGSRLQMRMSDGTVLSPPPWQPSAALATGSHLQMRVN
jgi:hypothetical protein